MFSLFLYTQKLNNYESEIKSGKNFEKIECEIIDYNGKFQGSVFKYRYQNNSLKASQQFTSSFLKIGEKYQGRVNKTQPEVAIILLDKPIIDTIKFDNTNAEIIEITLKKNNLKSVTYSYKILDKKYTRTEYINYKSPTAIGDKFDIYYKIIKPEIAYLKK